MGAAIPPEELQRQMANIGQDRGLAEVVVTAVFGFIALVTLVARLVQRGRKTHASSSEGLGIDDYLMVAAGLFAFAECLAIFVMYHYGVGKHFIAFKPQNLTPWAKWDVVLAFCYAAGLMLAKWSILALMWRIFAERSKYLRIGVWVMFTYTLLWALAVFLVIGLSCKPFSSLWSAPFCTPTQTPTIWTASFSCAGDVLIVLLPQPLIWRLKMTMRRRLAVSILMALGLFASVCSIIRIALSNQLDPFDPTYGTADVALFFALEVVFAIICGNLPTIHKPLVNTVYAANGYLQSVASRSRSWLSRQSSRGSFSDDSREFTGHGSNTSGSAGRYTGTDASREKDRSGLGEVEKRVTIDVEHSA